MKPALRQAQIGELIGRQGQMSVEALAAHFDVSAETIRRDLGQLAECGLLQKVHGGAKRFKLRTEGSLQERMAENAAAKRIIADKLVQLVDPGDTIFVDTGSTTLICAEVLATIDRLTVITNSIAIAQVFGAAPTGSVIYLLGGIFNGSNGETIGSLSIEQIAGFQADHAIISVAAIDRQAGVMDASFDEAQVARAMIEHSRTLLVAVDSTKFDRKAAFVVCPLAGIDVLISDRPLEADFAAVLQAVSVEVR